jgi:heme exporter protein D
MPENTSFYQLAYGVTMVVYAAYGVSLVLRRRALARRRARAFGTAGVRGA